MSDVVPAGPPPSELLRTRPTAALVRATIIGSGTVALAVLLGRPALVLAGLPLLLWAAVAVARRIARGEDRGVPRPTLTFARRIVEEGASTSMSVHAAPGLLVTASVPLRAHLDLGPRHGSITGSGRARLRATAHRWGRVALGPTHVVLTDPLGAFRVQHTLPEVGVQVVPRSPILDAPVHLPDPVGASGVHLSRRRGDGTALSEVRPYRPGDRLHRVNWRATSRTGTLHTNATFTEQDTDVLIVTDTVVDVQPGPGAGEDAPSSLDMTIRATGAIARHYVTLGDRVGVFDIGHLIGPVPAGTGPRQLRILTDALSRAQRTDGRARPARRLRRIRPGTLTVFCSPLLSDVALEQIGVLRAHGAHVIVVDTLPPSVGDTAMLRGKPLRIEGHTSPRFWAEAWALLRLLRRKTIRELQEAGVPVTAWQGPSSLAPVLLSLSQARSAPRMRRS